MSKNVHWILPHATGILAALVLGPLLSSMAWVDDFTIPLTAVTGGHAVRLVSHGIALGLVMTLAVSAHQQLPDNGRGSSFLRMIVLPAGALIVLVLGGKALRTAGLPLIHQIGPSVFAQGYTIALLACGLWLSIAWLRHLEPLRNSFASARTGPRGTGAMKLICNALNGAVIPARLRIAASATAACKPPNTLRPCSQSSPMENSAAPSAQRADASKADSVVRSKAAITCCVRRRRSP